MSTYVPRNQPFNHLSTASGLRLAGALLAVLSPVYIIYPEVPFFTGPNQTYEKASRGGRLLSLKFRVFRCSPMTTGRSYDDMSVLGRGAWLKDNSTLQPGVMNIIAKLYTTIPILLPSPCL